MLLSNLWDKVQAEDGVLGFENECAVTKKILDDAMLASMYVLKHPEIDTLMIVRCNKFLLDAVYAFIGDDDDVEKMVVKVFEKFEVGEDIEDCQNREESPPCEFIGDSDMCEDRKSDYEDECVPTDELQKGITESYPVLSRIEYERLIPVLFLEIHTCWRA